MTKSGGVTPSPESTKSKKIKYIILGCGSIGYNILGELNESDENILIVDKNEKRVEDLRDHHHQVILGDITDSKFVVDLPVPDVVFVMSSEHSVNLTAIQLIREYFPSAKIIARSVDTFSIDVLADKGADVVIYPQMVVAKSAINHMLNLQSVRSAQTLHHLLGSWTGTLGIITHRNPDPDAISSAMALAKIAEDASNGKLNIRIIYEGNVGHQENRAFVNLLEIKMERCTPELLGECNHLALVDSPGPGNNNSLPSSTNIEILIDHHSSGAEPFTQVPLFSEIRPDAGATASIMTKFLQELETPIDTKLATALYYGIRSDTREFQRNIHPQDLHNAAFLLPLTDHSLLELIMAPSLSQETVDIISRAISNREVKQGYLFTNVGYVRNRDSIPQAADMLLNLEGVSTALVCGITDNAIVISGRNKDIRLNLGEVMHEAFSVIPGASAGGHATMAALSLPLSGLSILVKDKDELMNMVIEPLLVNFEKLVGITKAEEDEK